MSTIAIRPPGRLVDVQRAFRELGRIRIGTSIGTGKTNKLGEEIRRPTKLETFRLTSPSQVIISNAAALLGGEVSEWRAHDNDGQQWQVITTAKAMEVVIPPGEAVQQAWEMWTRGGCARRCPGFGGIETLSGKPCMCPEDTAVRADLAKQNPPAACRPNTRLRVMLPDLPDLGVWRLESNGIYAAIELAGTHELLRSASAAGVHVPAVLRLEQRQQVTGGQTRRYAVPVLEIGATPRQLMTGEGIGSLSTAIASSQERYQALTTGTRPALEAAPSNRAEPVAFPEDAHGVAALARQATTRGQITAIGKQARVAGMLADYVDGPGDTLMTLEDFLLAELERVSGGPA